jgi:hypothetical protein
MPDLTTSEKTWRRACGSGLAQPGIATSPA